MATNHPATGALAVHALQTGRLIGNKTFLRGQGWSSLLRRRDDYEFPVYSYVIEHPEGLIAIDTGLSGRVRVPRAQRRFAPRPLATAGDDIAAQMRARGLSPDDVRRVVVTHLDWDHAGGLAHFPNAEVLVHRPEYEFASTFMGRQRYQPRLWPAGFAPSLYDLDGDACGPFPRSRAVTDSGDVRIVPLPGHSVAQVGVVAQANGVALMFAADHMLRQDWFAEDCAAGRLLQLGVFFPDAAVETSRRIRRFVDEIPTVLLPAHDADAPARLAAMEPLSVRDRPPAAR